MRWTKSATPSSVTGSQRENAYAATVAGTAATIAVTGSQRENAYAATVAATAATIAAGKSLELHSWDRKTRDTL